MFKRTAQLLLLSFFAATSALASLSAFVSGNTIYYSARGTDPAYNCVSVSLDYAPYYGGFCSIPGPGSVSSSFSCNWVGTHVVSAQEYNSSGSRDLGSVTVFVATPPGPACTMPLNDILFDINQYASPNDKRVLISNLHYSPGTTTPDHPYPHYQSLLAKDAAIPVNMRVFVNGAPTAGVSVALTLVDPPDQSEYIVGPPTGWSGQPLPGGALSHSGDNFGPMATFHGNCIPCATYNVTSGSDGYIETEVDLDPMARGGDNYQVVATATFSDGSRKTVSGPVVTAWKRMFLEKKLMFRRGAPLATDAPAGVTNIVVENADISATGEEFHNGDTLLLLHAPPIGQPKTAGSYYQGMYTITARPHAFTARGPQPGPGTITTNSTTTVTGTHAHFNALHSGDVLGIGTEFRYVLSTSGADTAVINAPFTFVGTPPVYTVGDPNLLNHARHHYLRLELDRPLNESYQREPAVNAAAVPVDAFLALNDAVVRLSAATFPPSPDDYYSVSDNLLVGAAESQPAHAFPAAYTEYMVLPPSGGVAPRAILAGDPPHIPITQRFVDKWDFLPAPVAVPPTDPYYNANDGLTWFRYSTPPNHQLLLVGSTDAAAFGSAGANGFLSLLSTGGSREMVSVLLRGNTEHYVTHADNALYGADPNAVLQRTEVHEITHQWQTNPAGVLDHCRQQVAYTSSAPYPASTTSSTPPAGLEFCLMALADGSTTTMTAPFDSSLTISMVQYLYRNGLTHDHVPAAAGGYHSEYLRIRQASDPWRP